MTRYGPPEYGPEDPESVNKMPRRQINGDGSYIEPVLDDVQEPIIDKKGERIDPVRRVVGGTRIIGASAHHRLDTKILPGKPYNLTGAGEEVIWGLVRSGRRAVVAYFGDWIDWDDGVSKYTAIEFARMIRENRELLTRREISIGYLNASMSPILEQGNLIRTFALHVESVPTLLLFETIDTIEGRIPKERGKIALPAPIPRNRLLRQILDCFPTR